MYRLLFTPLLILLLGTCARAQKMLPVDVVPGMVDEVYELIRDEHPFGARALTREELDRARTQVQKNVVEAMAGRDSLPYHEFTALVSPLQRATRCGHLILGPYGDSLSDARLRENYFPLQMIPIDSGATFVLRKKVPTATGDTLLPGTIVRAADDMPLPELMPRLAVFAGVNDQANDYASLTVTARGFYLPYQRYYGRRDSIILTLDDGSKPVIYPRHRPYVDPKEVPGDINESLRFRLSDDRQTGIMDIRSFSAVKYENGNYFKWIAGVMDSLRTGNTPNLIIDLRGNTGGSSGRISYLYSYLSPDRFRFADGVEMTGPLRAQPGDSPKKTKRLEAGAVTRRERRIQRNLTKELKPRKDDKRYQGKVIVLIDEITFSASGMFARYVQGSGRGTLIGTTSGASANITYGGSMGLDKKKLLIGPNNEFRMRVNNVRLLLPYATPGNVTPDITITPTIKDIREGKDVILNAALEQF